MTKIQPAKLTGKGNKKLCKSDPILLLSPEQASSAGVSICGYFCRKMTAPAMKRAAAE
jgi:hypothetical protein